VSWCPGGHKENVVAALAPARRRYNLRVRLGVALLLAGVVGVLAPTAALACKLQFALDKPFYLPGDSVTVTGYATGAQSELARTVQFRWGQQGEPFGDAPVQPDGSWRFSFQLPVTAAAGKLFLYADAFDASGNKLTEFPGSDTVVVQAPASQPTQEPGAPAETETPAQPVTTTTTPALVTEMRPAGRKPVAASAKSSRSSAPSRVDEPTVAQVAPRAGRPAPTAAARPETAASLRLRPAERAAPAPPPVAAPGAEGVAPRPKRVAPRAERPAPERQAKQPTRRAQRPDTSVRAPRTPVLEALPPVHTGREPERSPLSLTIGVALLAVLILASFGGAVLARRRRPAPGDSGVGDDSRMDELEAELQEIIAEERARRRESLER
jgi:hypothetical protein